MSDNNKFVFIQTGEADSNKFYVVCSMCLVSEQTFKNLVILDQLRFADLENIKNTNVEAGMMATGIKNYIAPAFKISGNQYFIQDSLKDIVKSFISCMPDQVKSNET